MIKLAYGQSRLGSRSSQAAEGSELRRAPRVELLHNSAKLVTGSGELLCLIRDVSCSGVSIMGFHPLPGLDDMILELPSGERLPIHRVWSAGDRAGFRFDGVIDLSRLLEANAGGDQRAIRINLDAPCRLWGESFREHALLCNLSQTGALLRSEIALPVGHEIQISAPAMPRTLGQVRWNRANYAGVVFANAFELARLATVVRDLQAFRANA